MTEKEKMIEKISDVIWRYEPLLKYEPTPAPPEIPTVPEAIADALIAAGVGDVKEAKKEAKYWKNEAKTARADIDGAVKEITERIFCELRDWFAEQYDYDYEIKASNVVCDIVTIAEKYGVELGAKDDD